MGCGGSKEPATIKCCCVGDGAVGKTCLLISYTKDEFPTKYVPTVFENYIAHLEYKGRPVELDLRDTAGQEDFDRLRHLSYPDTNVFLVIFSVVHPTSFDNITTKWIPELKHHCPEARWILVGTKSDLRDDPDTVSELKATGQVCLTREQGVKLAKDIGAAAYVECSALKREGIQEIFDKVAAEGLKMVG